MNLRLVLLGGVVLAAAAGLWLLLGQAPAPTEAALARTGVAIPPGYPDVFDPAFQDRFLAATSHIDPPGREARPVLDALTEVRGRADFVAPFCFRPAAAAVDVGAECDMRLYRVRMGSRTTYTAVYRLPGGIPAAGVVVARRRAGDTTLVLRALPDSVPLAQFDARARALALQP